MTDKAVEDKVISMLDALQNGATELGKTAIKYAPDVTQAALQIVRIDAISNIFIPFIMMITAAIILKVAVKRGITLRQKEEYSNYEPFFVIATIAGIICLLCFICLLDIWNWIALFNPRLVLAHDIVRATLHQTCPQK